MTANVPLMIISGPVGVGKTSIGEAIAELLDERGVCHALIDTDSLNRLFPRPLNDRFAEELMVANLAAIAPNFIAAGARYIILTGVVESPEHLRRYQQSVGASSVQLVRLAASLPTLRTRLHQRETDESLEWHLNRAEELALQMNSNPFEDVLIATDNQAVRDIAVTILQRCWPEIAENET